MYKIFAANNATSPQSPSIFGGASNPTSGASLFGGSASFGSPQPQSTGSVFGSSAFGGSGATSGGFAQQTSNATSSPSAFGGGSFSQATSNAPAFGATAPFGSSPVRDFSLCY